MQEQIANSIVSAMEAAGSLRPAPDQEADPVAPANRPAVAIDVERPAFSPLRDAGKCADDTSIQRFYDVNVTVSAELGRVTMPIKDLLQLAQGSVVELNRPVTGPIDLVANGVRIARGEVVVVDDCFAVHIKQIEPQGR
jgi:flagellar motor switch protein FliN/FliY